MAKLDLGHLIPICSEIPTAGVSNGEAFSVEEEYP